MVANAQWFVVWSFIDIMRLPSRLRIVAKVLRLLTTLVLAKALRLLTTLILAKALRLLTTLILSFLSMTCCWKVGGFTILGFRAKVPWMRIKVTISRMMGILASIDMILKILTELITNGFV